MWLRSSRQPTSISRSPFRQSRPVVSVSRTISRTSPSESVRARAQADRAAPLKKSGGERQGSQYIVDLSGSVGVTSARIHDEMRPSPLYAIRDLARQQRFELSRVHAWPGEDPSPLDRRVRGHHNDDIDAALPSRLEEKRHVDNGQAPPLRPASRQKFRFALADERVHDGFQLRQRLRVSDYPLGKPRA